MSGMSFKFPFKPYDIQNKFMNRMYEAIRDKKVCLIESPTGTGKSMSIICAIGKWLEDYKIMQRSTPDIYLKELNEKSCENDYKMTLTVVNSNNGLLNVKKPAWLKAQITELANEATHEEIDSIRSALVTLDSFDSKSVLSKNYLHTLIKSDVFEQIKKHIPRIFYCSRTISQLDQFASEIKKSPYANDFRVTLYSSRERMCINEKVIKSNGSYGRSVNITQKCDSISTNCIDTNAMCPYYSKYLLKHNSIPNNIISTTDWKDWGKQEGICPYFANKFNLNMAEIVLIPYATLFSSKIVNQLKLNLENSVTIIDEGHNIVNAIQNTFDACVEKHHFVCALDFYNKCQSAIKIMAKDKTKNENHMNDLSNMESFIYILRSIIDRLDKSLHIEEISPMELFSSCHIENFNISQVISYLSSNLNRIFRMFLKQTHTYIHKSKKDFSIHNYRQSLFEVLGFFDILVGACEDDFIIIDSEKKRLDNGQIVQNKTIKLLHLNLKNAIKPLVDKCRSVIIVGGTLHPNDNIINLLENSGVQKHEIIQESYDHIVDKKQLFPAILSHGVLGSPFNFRYENRISDNVMLKDLGYTIKELCQCIPDGIVCFFPSFGFLGNVITLWKNEKIFDEINVVKPIFYETLNRSCGNIFEEYSASVAEKKGGIFFAIMNGKVSEGINFSDELARSVLIVGMPFMPIQMPSVYLRLDHICQKNSVKAAMDFYEKTCMTIVNQCVGRSIRHRNDFASMIYLDLRYNRPNHRNNISNWISSNIKHFDSVSSIKSQLTEFYCINSKNISKEI